MRRDRCRRRLLCAALALAMSCTFLGCGGCGGSEDGIPEEMDHPGWLEYPTPGADERISGWAWDRTDQKRIVTVDILVDGKKIATLKAGQYRSDLPKRGKYGFSMLVPDDIKDGKVHKIVAHNVDEDSPLGNTPITYQSRK